MILKDYHMHTTFCDGKNTPEEMVISAIEKGMAEIGITIHSYVSFDEEVCKREEDVDRFFENVSLLKDKYRDKIKILCGIEQDYYSNPPTHKFDYIIGSVHYLKQGDDFLSLDLSSENLDEIVKTHYNNDYLLLAEDYYNTLQNVVTKTGADIIGHIDLITKFVEKGTYFDIVGERYLTAAKKAIDKLIKYDKPFEINVGAISRGYRTSPYPAGEILSYIKEKGGKLILSSDAHSAENIRFQFDIWEKLLK